MSYRMSDDAPLYALVILAGIAIVAVVVGDLQPLDAAYSLLEATQPPAAWTAGTR